MINILQHKFERFEQDIHKSTEELFKKEYRAKVQTAITGCAGEQLPNFLPNPVLKHLISEKLDQLSQMVNILIEQCFHEVHRLLINHENTFQDDCLLMKLMPMFREVVGLHFKHQKDAVQKQVEDLIRLEKFDPYTMNNYYMNSVTKFKGESTSEHSNGSRFPFGILSSGTTCTHDVDEKRLSESVSKEDPAVKEMIYSIFSYWKVLTTRFIDYTALSIRAECVFSVCSGIRDRLRHIPVEQDDLVDVCLAPDASIQAEIKKLQQRQEILEKADATLDVRGSTTVTNNVTSKSSPASRRNKGRKRKLT